VFSLTECCRRFRQAWFGNGRLHLLVLFLESLPKAVFTSMGDSKGKAHSTWSRVGNPAYSTFLKEQQDE